MEAQSVLVGVIGCMLLVIFSLLYKIFRDQSNTLSCSQFISTKGADGNEYADIDKLGKVMALVISTAIVVYYTYRTPLDGPGGPIFLALITLYLGFAGGVAGYSAFLRSKQPQPG